MGRLRKRWAKGPGKEEPDPATTGLSVSACPNCGEETSVLDAFCPKCGTILSEEE